MTAEGLTAEQILYGRGQSREISERTKLQNLETLMEEADLAAEGIREECMDYESVPALFFHMLSAGTFPEGREHHEQVAQVITRMIRWIDRAPFLALEKSHPQVLQVLAYAPSIVGQLGTTQITPAYERLVNSYLKYYRGCKPAHAERVDDRLTELLNSDDHQSKSYPVLMEPEPDTRRVYGGKSTGARHLVLSNGRRTPCGVSIPDRHDRHVSKHWRGVTRTKDERADYWEALFRKYDPDSELKIGITCSKCKKHADSDQIKRSPLSDHEQLIHAHAHVRKTVPFLFVASLDEKAHTPEEIERRLQELIWQQSLEALRLKADLDADERARIVL